jgi:hypothetical protein
LYFLAKRERTPWAFAQRFLIALPDLCKVHADSILVGRKESRKHYEAIGNRPNLPFELSGIMKQRKNVFHQIGKQTRIHHVFTFFKPIKQLLSSSTWNVRFVKCRHFLLKNAPFEECFELLKPL